MKKQLSFVVMVIAFLFMMYSSGFAATETWDGGTYNITSGTYDEIGLINGAQAAVSGDAWFGRLELYDTCQAILADNGYICDVRLFGNSTFTITGGGFPIISIKDYSELFVYGGSIVAIGATDGSQVNIYTTDENFILSSIGGELGFGYLQGYLINGDYIEADLGSGAYSHIHLIPEPATLSLFLCGIGLTFRKRNQG